MLGAARAYAEANQATLMTPFILAGAMAPVTAAGVCAQTLAEALAGMTFVQLVRPGAPVVLGSFALVDVDAVGGADVRHPGAGPRPVRHGRARPPARRPVPLRRQPVRLEDRRRPGRLRVAPRRFSPTILAGVNFVLHAAGWLEGGLAVGYEKFILDADQCGMAAVFVKGVDMSENGQALDAILANGPGQHFLGTRPHAGQLRDRVLPDATSPTTTATSSGRRTARSTPPSGRT